MRLIENIRNKPHEHKVRIIWICAGVVAVVMIVLWILVGKSELDPNQSLIQNIKNTVGNPKESFPKFFNGK